MTTSPPEAASVADHHPLKHVRMAVVRRWLTWGSCTSCRLINETAQQPAEDEEDSGPAQAPAQLNVLEPVCLCDPPRLDSDERLDLTGPYV